MSDETPAPAAAKSGGMLVGLIAVGAVSFLASLGTTYLSSAKATEPAAACIPGEEGVHTTAPLAKADQVYVPLKELIVTISGGATNKFLKLQIAIVTDAAGESSVKKAEPLLTDAFVAYLRSVSITDFEDPNFYLEMREQLALRSELVLGGAVSDGVLITEFLIR